MDREGFLDTIRKQYVEKIHTAYMSCEHEFEGKKRVDWIELNQALTKLMKTARVDGLPAREFMDLVKAELPEAWRNLEPHWFKVAA